ncbi:MAG TPA: hypothetical protein PK646_00305 [Bacillota bacterium]|nr:hypothetical protein [Bacillota bacterium]
MYFHISILYSSEKETPPDHGAILQRQTLQAGSFLAGALLCRILSI